MSKNIITDASVAKVTITTHDGKVYTDPKQIKVPRNEHTEMFYHLLEIYEPPQKETESTKKDKTA